MAEIARLISDWIGSGAFETLGLITVLEGGRPFSADLSRQVLSLRPSVRLVEGVVRVRGTSGTHLLREREVRLEGWDTGRFQNLPLLLVDDLVDSGRTLQAVKDALADLETGRSRPRWF